MCLLVKPADPVVSQFGPVSTLAIRVICPYRKVATEGNAR